MPSILAPFGDSFIILTLYLFKLPNPIYMLPSYEFSTFVLTILSESAFSSFTNLPNLSNSATAYTFPIAVYPLGAPTVSISKTTFLFMKLYVFPNFSLKLPV